MPERNENFYLSQTEIQLIKKWDESWAEHKTGATEATAEVAPWINVRCQSPQQAKTKTTTTSYCIKSRQTIIYHAHIHMHM